MVQKIIDRRRSLGFCVGHSDFCGVVDNHVYTFPNGISRSFNLREWQGSELFHYDVRVQQVSNYASRKSSHNLS